MEEVSVNYSNVRLFIAIEHEVAQKLLKLNGNQKQIVTCSAPDMKQACLESIQWSNQIKALCAEQSKLISQMTEADFQLIRQKATK